MNYSEPERIIPSFAANNSAAVIREQSDLPSGGREEARKGEKERKRDCLYSTKGDASMVGQMQPQSLAPALPLGLQGTSLNR